MSKGEAPKGTFRTEIPFELESGLIIIKAKLNDSEKEYEFIVDSGAPFSVIYQEALEESKAKTVMASSVSDSQGNAVKSDYVMLNVGIGDLVFKEMLAAHTNPHELLRCIAYDGIIGANLMQTANWQIDFENKKIIISDRKKSSLPDLKDYQRVSFSKRSAFGSMPWLHIVPGMTVDVKVNGKLFKDVLVDSGSSGALTIPKNEVTDTLFKNDLKEVLTGYSSFGLFGANMDTSYNYSSSDIYMGNLRIDKHRIDVANQNKSLLGMEIFSNYAMVIDFRKKDMYLKPLEKKTKDEKELGFKMLYDSKSGTCYVGMLFLGSSAALAGLQLNDTIVEVNEQKIPVFADFCEFRVWSKKMTSQEILMIKTKRDDEVIRIEEGIIPKM
jgi:predicted aspartyl protease